MSRPEKKEAEVITESTELARTDLEPQALIQTALERNASIETLERLFALAKEVQAQRARQAWFRAISEFQARCPTIFKNKEARTERYSFRYASLDNILEVVAPPLSEVGLSISWRLIADLTDEKRVTYVCRVSHALGHHEESGPVTIPIVQRLPGELGANAQQRVGIAHSYSKRYSCLAALGIAPKDDEAAQADQERESSVAQPKRTSEKAEAKPEPAKPTEVKKAAEANAWVGRCKGVTSRRTSYGTLFLVTGEDGQEFGTFEPEHARFAEDAGNLLIEIRWKKTAKGHNGIVSIGPAEPGSGDGA